MDENKIHFWLRNLFYIQIAGLLFSLLSGLSPIFDISFGGDWITWANRIVNLAVIVCLFLLPMRYQISAILKAVCLIIGVFAPMILETLIPQIGIELYVSILSSLNVITLVLALVALYLEYRAHASYSDEKTAKHWHLLFFAPLLLTVVSVFLATPLSALINSMDHSAMKWSTTLINTLSTLITLFIHVVYLYLLNRTITHVESEEKNHG